MRWMSGFAGLAVVIGVALLGTHFVQSYHRSLHDPLPLEQTRFVVVKPGQGFRGILAELAEQGWVRYPWLVELQARADGRAARLQAGEYAVMVGMSLTDVLNSMLRGEVVQHRITVPEGWRAQQFLEALLEHPALDVQDLEPEWPVLMAALGLDGQHPEGWFMPDTYVFNRGTALLQVLQRSHQAMQQALEQAWAARQDDHPLTDPYELLILASIIERETGSAAERAKVAAVFINRLRRGMRLQTDPTLLYALESGARLTRAELRRDHPYNTYTRDGLPPTPIALPGRAALLAAAQPAQTDALFFVARGDGTHQFSRTYAEHRAAVVRYQLGGDASRYGGGR